MSEPNARPNGQAASGGHLTRRRFLTHGATMVAAGTVAAPLLRTPAWAKPARDLAYPHASQSEALAVLGRTAMRLPDSTPNAALPAGTDTIPEIQHVVILMMENHSYDNLFGMLGRGRHQKPRGDGFTLASDGYPTAINPDPDGEMLRAFHMPTTCQLDGKPSQEWEQSHIQYAKGTNFGFVISDSGPVAMGYWTGRDLPFTYDLASRFPIGDRWFCSALAQTDPNRRYLIAGTSFGMTDDIGGSPGNLIPDLSLPAPTNGTIFERLTAAGISWTDYCESFPTGATMELYPTVDAAFSVTNVKSIDKFFTDAKRGSLPSVSLLDPNYDTQSQENPQNIVVGEAFLSQVVRAIGASPAWRRTMLIVTYDEHGGYFDHVPPPAAVAPDKIPPIVQPGESAYDGFARYGFRVPSVIVSPYAKRNHVSHVVYDHTSILAFIERKWNLKAMTLRDANANDLTDFLDMTALQAGNPTFPELPALAAPGNTAAALACSKTGPGQIPPPPPPPARLPKIRVEMRNMGIRRRLHGLLIELRASHGTLTGLEVELHRGKQRIARHSLHKLAHAERRILFRVHGHVPPKGRYTVVVRNGKRTFLKRAIRVR